MGSRNPLDCLNRLRNTYLGMRHGRSQAQELGIILSSVAEGGKPEYSLVKAGREEVQESVEAAMREGILDSRVVIFSSPLSRALETAEIGQKVLKAGTVVVDHRLRERFFGRYDGKSNKYYQAVWDLDVVDPSHTDMGVESANDVQSRFGEVIAEAERDFNKRIILLVGHGDLLQIGETGFFGLPASVHRSLSHLKNAEIRPYMLRKAVRGNQEK